MSKQFELDPPFGLYVWFCGQTLRAERYSVRSTIQEFKHLTELDMIIKDVVKQLNKDFVHPANEETTILVLDEMEKRIRQAKKNMDDPANAMFDDVCLAQFSEVRQWQEHYFPSQTQTSDIEVEFPKQTRTDFQKYVKWLMNRYDNLIGNSEEIRLSYDFYYQRWSLRIPSFGPLSFLKVEASFDSFDKVIEHLDEYVQNVRDKKRGPTPLLHEIRSMAYEYQRFNTYMRSSEFLHDGKAGSTAKMCTMILDNYTCQRLPKWGPNDDRKHFMMVLKHVVLVLGLRGILEFEGARDCYLIVDQPWDQIERQLEVLFASMDSEEYQHRMVEYNKLVQADLAKF